MGAPPLPPVEEAINKCMRAMMAGNPVFSAVKYLSADMTATQARLLGAAAENMRVLADSLKELAEIRLEEIGKEAAND